MALSLITNTFPALSVLIGTLLLGYIVYGALIKFKEIAEQHLRQLRDTYHGFCGLILVMLELVVELRNQNALIRNQIRAVGDEVVRHQA